MPIVPLTDLMQLPRFGFICNRPAVQFQYARTDAVHAAFTNQRHLPCGEDDVAPLQRLLQAAIFRAAQLAEAIAQAVYD